MSINATALGVVDWSRKFIPDPKTRTKSVRGLEVGKTSLATVDREIFYIKNQAVGTVKLYVDPYVFTSTASLKTAVSTDKVFMYNATLQKCTFPSASTDSSIRPEQFKPVLADYNYTANSAYVYDDREIVQFMPAAISYLNNTYSFSFTYTGTVNTFQPSFSSDNDKEIIAMAVAVVVRTSYVGEQMRKGLGVAFKGPLTGIDSVQQMKEYNSTTKTLENTIQKRVDESEKDGIPLGQGVDIYDEEVVDA